MTTITHYTTYDLASYYRETRRLPRLSVEEEQRLVALLASAAAQPLPAPQVTQAKGRLIEGHLELATRIAIELCPSRRPLSLDRLLDDRAVCAFREAMSVSPISRRRSR